MPPVPSLPSHAVSHVLCLGLAGSVKIVQAKRRDEFCEAMRARRGFLGSPLRTGAQSAFYCIVSMSPVEHILNERCNEHTNHAACCPSVVPSPLPAPSAVFPAKSRHFLFLAPSKSQKKRSLQLLKMCWSVCLHPELNEGSSHLLMIQWTYKCDALPLRHRGEAPEENSGDSKRTIRWNIINM